MTEKRVDFRAAARYPLWFRPVTEDIHEDAGWHSALTRDLSGGGAAFHAPEAVLTRLGPGNLLEVQLMIPGGPVFAIGRVARISREEGQESLLALEFVSLPAGDKDRIVGIVLSEGLGKCHDNL